MPRFASHNICVVGRTFAIESIKVAMTVYSFYLFDRRGTCLHYNEWDRPRPLPGGDHDGDRKNMFGLVFALRNMTGKLASGEVQTARRGIPKYFVTDVYALHYHETLTGLRFILTTGSDFDRNVDITEHLAHIYANIFVPTIVLNPLYVPGTVVNNIAFSKQLDQYVRSLQCFK